MSEVVSGWEVFVVPFVEVVSKIQYVYFSKTVGEILEYRTRDPRRIEDHR